jgi:hypothetical protein
MRMSSTVLGGALGEIPEVYSLEGRDLALGGAHEELCCHGDEDAVVAGGVIDKGVAQLLGHQGSVAGTFEQVIQTRQQFLACGEFGRQSSADA